MVKRIFLICSVIVIQTWAQSPADKEDASAGKEKTAVEKVAEDTEIKEPKPEPVKKEETVKKEAETTAPPPAEKKQKKDDKKEPEKKSKPVKRSAAKEEKVEPPVDNIDVSTAVEIPSGVLFGKFAKEDGPFLLQGSIIVPSGQTLEFGPGCKIFVGGKYSTITVFGQLIAKGTPMEPVIFQSANKKPNPWDWDRIYCRSRRRSSFEYCLIRHSNYGIYVENGSAEIKNCTFAHNSLHGLVVKNSDVVISTSVFKRGHVCAIFCDAGASVIADSLTLKNNITGIACANKSYLKMERGVIKGNNNGLAVREGASVNIIAADITSNKTGVVSEKLINKKLREMVYKNTLDMKIVTPAEMEKILKPPEEVKSIVLPKTKTEIQVSNYFKPGFSALRAPREQTASFIGNVSIGFKYFAPTTQKHPRDIDTNTSLPQKYGQTKYLGEHSDDWYAGFQPEIIVFAQGKRGLLDVNLNSDLYVNTWVENYMKANLFTLSMNYADQHIVIGDYYENISETSISGRKLRGIKYTGNFWPMGRGTKRVEFKLAAGQSEPKKDFGDPEVELFGDTVDTGSSIRQQLTYVADLAVKPTHNVTISVRGLISHDQDAKPLFSKEIEDTAVPDPVSAATGCIEANVVLFDGKMEITAELDMGAADTLRKDTVITSIDTVTTISGTDSIVYDTTIDESDFEEIAWYKPQITKAVPRVFGVIHPDSNNYAFLLDVQGTVQGFDLGASYMEIAENYFSAGNPYLEPDRRIITFDAEKQFSDKLNAKFGYEYERTSGSYIFAKDEETPTDNNTFELEGSYAFGENKPSISADYGLRIQGKDDMGSYVYYVPEDTVVDSITGDTSITLTSATEDSMYEYSRIDNSIALEVKQRFKNGIDFSLKYQFVNKNDISVYPDSIDNANNDDTWENTITGRFGFRIKRRVRNKTTIKVKFKNEEDEDMNRIDFKISDNLRINIIPRKLTLSLKGEYRKRVEEEDNDSLYGVRDEINLTQMTIQTEIKYAITSRLSLILMGKYEDYYDESESSTENYDVKIGGLHLTYLF